MVMNTLITAIESTLSAGIDELSFDDEAIINR
jgi:hypothetical protein